MTPKIIVFAALLCAGTATAVVNADALETLDNRHLISNGWNMNEAPWKSHTIKKTFHGLVPKPEPAKRAKGNFGPVFASN